MALTSISDAYGTLKQSPVWSFLGICVIVCLSTRAITGWRQYTEQRSRTSPRTIAIVPYWIPWLGHTFQFGAYFQSFLGQARIQAQEDAFAIVLGGQKHNIITQPSITKDLLNMRQSQLSSHDFALLFVEKFWNDRGTTRQIPDESIWKSIHPALYQLSREPFLSKAIKRTAESVESLTHSLISFNHSWVDQASWERSSHVSVLSGDAKVAEADLYHLVRDFVGDIACNVLMGRDFQTNFPNVMEDLWTADAKFSAFIMGVPGWTPGLGAAAAARDRVVSAVRKHHEAVWAMVDGKDADSMWSDDLLSDCSNVMVDRAMAYKASGGDMLAAAAGDAGVLWAMMVNANQVVYWMLFHVYSQPELLTQIRNEIAPYVKIETLAQSQQTSIKPPPKLSIDLKSLMNECPLLQATFFETMRVDTLSSSVKQVMEDITVTESLEDTELQGRSVPYTYHIPKGEVLWVPHTVHQRDGRYWPDPEKFEPRRFWIQQDDQQNQDGKVGENGEKGNIRVEYKTMKVWGGGPTMCKGKGFAEAEVIMFVAAIYVMWDIEDVDGRWAHPSQSTGGGTAQPKRNTRVRLRPRF